MTAYSLSDVLWDRLRLSWLLPADLRDSGSFKEQQAKLLILSSLATVLVAIIFAINHSLHGASLLGYWLVAGALLLLFTPLLVYYGFSLRLAANWFAFQCYVALCMVVVFDGGVSAASLAWLYLPPVVAYVFAGRRSGTFWFLLSVATCLATIVLDQLITFPDVVDEDIPAVAVGGAVGLITVNTLLFLVYAYQQRWLQESLAAAQREALDASQHSFRTLIENSPEAIVVLREKGRPVYTNQAVRKMLDYTLEELQRVELGEVIPAVELDRIDQIRAAFGRGEAFETEYESTRRRKDGAVLDVAVRIFTTSFQGEPALIVSMRDITERKQLQAKMMHMDRMIAVGTLAAGVAHEINNPLAFVSGNVGLLMAEYDNGTFANWQPPPKSALDQQELGEMLGDIVEGAERIRRIVSELRSFAREDKESDVAESVDLADLLESVLKMANHKTKHRATIVTAYDDVPPVLGSNAALGQVFLNLVVNAAHAIPPGNPEANEICIRTELHNEMVCVTVSDTGEGIPKAIQTRIFDPFFTTRSDQDGMGLGLYITQGIVQDHGGELTFESTPGEGTTFRVRLPVASRQPTDISGPLPAVSSAPSQASILAIDDEPTILRMLSRLLGGFEVTTLTSATAALEQLRQGVSYDIILCDFSMPQMSGAQFFRHLEQEFPELCERVIFITGGTITEEARAFAETCERPVLAKPFDIQHLRDTLADQLAAKDSTLEMV